MLKLIAGDRRGRLTGKFCGDERGGLTIFSLFIIIMMLMCGGLAVDFMRQETARVRLQSTLDRAILAAADMDQPLDPKSVVEDYFAKAGLTGYALNVQVADGMASRKVSATTGTKLDSYFLQILGIRQMDVPAAGAAEESLSNIEISLVLDVSTSMRSNSKIANMKVAAKEFVDTILDQTAPGKTTISLVPYSTQVSAGPDILRHLNVTAEHSYSNCVDFIDADYTHPGIDRTALLQRAGHFDPTENTSRKTPSTFVCRTDAAMNILPVSGDRAKLKARIDGLVADGYTSIDVGVKWGSALLDPQAQGLVDDLIADGVVQGSYDARPFAYEDKDALKVVVVMTDGINTNQWYLNRDVKAGISNVWLDPATNRYSIKGSELTSLNKDGDLALNESYYIPGNTGNSKWLDQPLGGTNARQLTWAELWARVTPAYHAWSHVYGMTGNYADYLLWDKGILNLATGLVTSGAFGEVDGPQKDTRLDTICTAAKKQGIVIYSVGFEVTDNSALVMQKCASTPSHFFRVEGVAITDAFKAIANDIGKLRLTQ